MSKPAASTNTDCSLAGVEWWESFKGQKTVDAQLEMLQSRPDFEAEKEPDALLSWICPGVSLAQAMAVAHVFEARLGLVAISVRSTSEAGEPRTLMDELDHRSYFIQECQWDEATYDFICKAFTQLGFKRSSGCTMADLVAAYTRVVGEELTARESGEREWIRHFRAWHNMVATLPGRLVDVLRARSLRYRTQQHFLKLDKVEYDYAAMKANRAGLHTEFSATYRIFRRLVAIRYATPMAVAVPVQQPHKLIKKEHP